MDEARGRVQTAAAAAAALGPAVSVDPPTTLPCVPNLSERKGHCEGRLQNHHWSAHRAMCLHRPFVNMGRSHRWDSTHCWSRLIKGDTKATEWGETWRGNLDRDPSTFQDPRLSGVEWYAVTSLLHEIWKLLSALCQVINTLGLMKTTSQHFVVLHVIFFLSEGEEKSSMKK